MIWARVTFGQRSFHLEATPTEGGLVTSGPYRLIRHPIYASVGLFTWVSAEYREYAQRTKRLIPYVF